MKNIKLINSSKTRKNIGLLCLLLISSILFMPKANAQAAGAGGCYVVGGFTAIYTYSTTSPMGGCASEATLSNQFTYLSTGRNMSMTGAIGGMAGVNDGVIELLRKLNDSLAKRDEGARQNMPNADLAARVRETDMAQRKYIAKYTRPISGEACREATFSKGLASSGYGGSGGGAGGSTNNSKEVQDRIFQKSIDYVLDPQSDINYLSDVAFGEYHKKFCTQSDVENKMPGCESAGSLPGANVNPTVLIRPAEPKGLHRSYSIDFSTNNPQKVATESYIKMVSPFPGPKVSVKAKNSSEAKQYLVYQRRYNSRVLAVVGALKNIAAQSAMLPENSPFVQNVWKSDENVKQEYKEIYGSKAKLPERPSERELMKFMVMKQFTTDIATNDMKSGDPSYFARRQVELGKLNAYLLLKLNEKMNWNNILTAQLLSNNIDPVSREQLMKKASAASVKGGAGKK